MSAATKPSSESSQTAGRLVSIDALRGADMLWLTGGALVFVALAKGIGNPQFLELAKNWTEHGPWIGCRPHDIILPLFFFIVGASMPLSYDKRLERGDNKAGLYRHIVVRTFMLMLMGQIAQSRLLELNFDPKHFKLLASVLESLAMGYFVAAIVYLNTKWRGQLITVAVFLLGSWAAMMWIPVPGYGAGDFSRDGNLVGWVDRTVLGPFYGGFYGGGGWGRIVSTPNCAVMLLCGALACQWLRSNFHAAIKVFGIWVIGGACLVVGLAWGEWLPEGWVLPMIRSIKSSSFTIYAVGWCLLTLGVFYLIIDVWGFKAWTFPFVVVGMNSLAVYMAVMVFDNLDEQTSAQVFHTMAEVLVGGLRHWLEWFQLGNWWPLTLETARTALIWLGLYWMYRTRSFWRV